MGVVEIEAVADERRLPRQECFLCDPMRDLVFLDRVGFVALAGLGPVVDGYSLIAAKAHVRSMADVPLELQSERNDVVKTVRERLTKKYGSCLITEHGRMGICVDDPSGLDRHCLHAHFLVFPGTSDISILAQTYFAKWEVFDDLAAALSQARLCEEYMLVSPTYERVNVFSKPLNVPGQLVRYLVAHDSDAMHLADWRRHPNFGLSMTELEFNAARASGKQMLLYVLDDEAPVPFKDIEKSVEGKAKLDALRAQLMREHVVAKFTSADDLAGKVFADLGKLTR